MGLVKFKTNVELWDKIFEVGKNYNIKAIGLG